LDVMHRFHHLRARQTGQYVGDPGVGQQQVGARDKSTGVGGHRVGGHRVRGHRVGGHVCTVTRGTRLQERNLPGSDGAGPPSGRTDSQSERCQILLGINVGESPRVGYLALSSSPSKDAGGAIRQATKRPFTLGQGRARSAEVPGGPSGAQRLRAALDDRDH